MRLHRFLPALPAAIGPSGAGFTAGSCDLGGPAQP
jgi:hypothetical protein